MSLFGGEALAGGLMDLAGSSLQNLFNKKEATKARNYATEMSNTAHQREVADLRAAGLNPLLSVRGSGASTPSGPSVVSADMSSVGSRMANTALAVKLNKAQVDLVESQALQSIAQARLANKQGVKLDSDIASNVLAQESQSLANIVQAANLKSQLTKAEFASQNEMLMKIERFNETLGRILGSGNSARSLLTP